MKPIKFNIGRVWKHQWILMGVLALILLAVSLVIWRGRTAAASAQSAEQRTSTVQKGALVITLSGSGPVEASQRKEIQTQVEGVVVQSNLQEGKTVKTGDVLAELTSTDAELNLKKMENALKQKELTAAQQSEQLDNLTVKAPIGGRITGLTLKEGDNVNKDQVICSIVDEDSMKVRAYFRGAASGQFKNISAIKVHIPDYAVSLDGTMDSLYASGMDTEAVIRIKNPGALAADLSCTVEITTSNGSFISEAAVLEWSEQQTVRAAASGIVENLSVLEKQTVSQGKTLFYIANDDLPTSVEGTLLELEKARFDYEQAKANRDKYTITAPFDGILVSTANLLTGDSVKAGTSLCVLLDTSAMKVEVSIDELDISKVKQGQNVILTVEALEETASRPIQGTVESVAVEGTSQNGVSVYPVTITLPGQEGLKVGMNVDATIQVLNKENVLLVPIEAVQKQGGSYYVWVKGGTEAEQPKNVSGEMPADRASDMSSIPGDTGGRGSMGNLSEEDRERFQNMTDEERQAMRESFRQQRGNAAGVGSPTGGTEGNSGSQTGSQSGSQTGSQAGSGKASSKSKSSGSAGSSYYEGATRVRVTIGDYNENTMEITGGLNEGDTVVLPQITSNTSSANSSNQGMSGIPGMNMPGGGLQNGGYGERGGMR